MSALISVEDLGKAFPLPRASAERHANRETGGSAEETFWALHGIGFSIRQGERVGLIGHTGAGKSSLLKILSRLMPPSRGRVVLRGRVASLPATGTGLQPELSGRENIHFCGAIWGMRRAEIRAEFDAIVALAGLENHLDTPIRRYSRAMQVRLGFAVAAHSGADILLFDETLDGSETAFQQKAIDKVRRLAQAGKSFLLAGHNLNTLLQCTERSLLLQAGGLRLDGDTATAALEYLRQKHNDIQENPLVARVPWFRIERFEYLPIASVSTFAMPLQFTLYAVLERDAPDLVLILAILNSLEARIATSKATIPCLKKGRHTLVLELSEQRLIPGSYSVSLICRVRGETIFKKQAAVALELADSQSDDPAVQAFAANGRDRLGSYYPLTVRLI